MKIAPSILAADLADLASAVKTCEDGGAQLIHVDVMDGHFVPNLTFGPPVIADLAKRSRVGFDIHLMVANPEALIDRYLDSGPVWVSFHHEATPEPAHLAARIRGRDVGAGVAINPGTAVDELLPYLEHLDFVVLMSVQPGFAGQAFQPDVLEKARELRAEIDARGLSTSIEMDGGIKPGNLDEVAAAGVDVAVVGSGVFAAERPVEALAALQRQANE
ncbi:MAG: ribulose-phosphate 3-epimerase [Acidobacteria bacterium]|nr:ribulose-phosphate 3-epimerase [Acidobacteriota bacterium]